MKLYVRQHKDFENDEEEAEGVEGDDVEEVGVERDRSSELVEKRDSKDSGKGSSGSPRN